MKRLQPHNDEFQYHSFINPDVPTSYSGLFNSDESILNLNCFITEKESKFKALTADSNGEFGPPIPYEEVRDVFLTDTFHFLTYLDEFAIL